VGLWKLHDVISLCDLFVNGFGPYLFGILNVNAILMCVYIIGYRAVGIPIQIIMMTEPNK
jgi:hypothetical protein